MHTIRKSAQMDRVTLFILLNQNKAKVLQNSMSLHNVTNPDKLNLVNQLPVK